METGNEAIWHRKEKRFLIFPLQEADPAAGVCSSCSRKTNVSFTAHTGVSAAVLAECSQLTSHVLLSSCYKHGSNTTNVCFLLYFYRHVMDIKDVQTAASLQQPLRRRFMNAMKATIVAKEAQSPNQFK